MVAGTVARPAKAAALVSAPPCSVRLFAMASEPRSKVPPVTVTTPVPKAAAFVATSVPASTVVPPW